MANAKSNRWVLAERPSGMPDQNTFSFEAVEIPEPAEGEILVGITHFSVDPGMRPSLSQASYAGALPLGAPVLSAAIGVVEQSRDPKFEAGDLVSGGFGWQDRVVVPARHAQKLDRDFLSAPLTHTAAIGVLGIPGLTSYFGILELGELKKDQTVLISSASGPVGATAGQIARIHGAHPVGIAGSQKKDRLVDKRGRFRHSHQLSRIQKHERLVSRSVPGRRRPLLRQRRWRDARRSHRKHETQRTHRSSRANSPNTTIPIPVASETPLAFITHRLRMEGFVVLDYAKQFREAQAALAGWIRSGDLIYREEIIDGIENAPDAFAGLFTGDNFGRRIIATQQATTPLKKGTP